MKTFIAGLLLIPGISFAATLKLDLKPYVLFAAEWTGREYRSEVLPKVKSERHEIVQIYAYGDYAYAQAESKGENLAEVEAVYVAEEKTVYVSEKLNLDDPKTKAILAHEMVHYLQDITGYTKSLNGHLACSESEAYDVQYLWQKANDVDPASLGFVWQQSLLSAMKCMGDQSAAISNAFKNAEKKKDLL